MTQFSEIVNQKIFDVPDYDQGHVTMCWEHPEVRRLMSNESSYSPIQAVRDAVSEFAAKGNFYAEDPTYALSLRSKLAQYCSVKPENLALGNGSIESLDLIFQIFMNEIGSDEAVLIQPDYSAYTPRLKFFGYNVKYADITGNIENAAEIIKQQINDHTKFVLFSRPNNPMGFVIPAEEIKKLLATGKVIICDEAYVEMADDGTSVSAWVPEHDNLIVLRTFSKGFSMAGYRFGYMMAHPEIIRYINRAKHIFNVNIFAMVGAEAALDHMDELRLVFKEIIDTREWMINEIGQIKGLKPLTSQANFIMIDAEESGIPATKFVDHLFEKGFLVRDFSKKAGLKPNTHFRISVGTRPDMELLINELKVFLA